MLSKEIYENPKKIAQLLKQPVVVLHNALEKEFAEDLYNDLVNMKLWQFQSTDNDLNPEYPSDYTYSRDQIEVNSPNAPDSVKTLNQYLNSDETKKWFSEVCGNSCDMFIGSATRFNKGDHIAEHNDRRIYNDPGEPKRVRTLTFNYYLSKGWEPEWGGQLVWKTPFQSINPDFNKLILFNVTTNSHHWVDPVVAEPRADRLSITGWYLKNIRQKKFSLDI